jgi:hypothetical protein
MKKNTMRKFTIVLLLQIGLFANAQEITRVENATGRYVIAGSISEDEARTKAIAQAKIDALRKAGVTENIQSYEMLYKSEIGNKFDEVFMYDMFSEIHGAVKKYDIVKIDKGIDEFKNFYIEAVIDAEVVLYASAKDPTFQVNIDGIKQGYQSGERMRYTVTPTHDCYLNIFNLYENNASLIFPNHFEKSRLFIAGEKVEFPISEFIDGYTLEKSTKEPETNNLVFVFTKDHIPYIKFKLNQEGDQITSFEDISAWLFSISPDRRVNYFIKFFIY